MNMLAVLACQMKNALVEGGEYQPVVNCQAEEVSICDLFVAV